MEVKGAWTQELYNNINRNTGVGVLNSYLYLLGGYGGAIKISKSILMTGTGTGFSGVLSAIETLSRQTAVNSNITAVGQMRADLFLVYAPSLLKIMTKAGVDEWLTLTVFVSDRATKLCDDDYTNIVN